MQIHVHMHVCLFLIAIAYTVVKCQEKKNKAKKNNHERKLNLSMVGYMSKRVFGNCSLQVTFLFVFCLWVLLSEYWDIFRSIGACLVSEIKRQNNCWHLEVEDFCGHTCLSSRKIKWQKKRSTHTQEKKKQQKIRRHKENSGWVFSEGMKGKNKMMSKIVKHCEEKKKQLWEEHTKNMENW